MLALNGSIDRLADNARSDDQLRRLEQLQNNMGKVEPSELKKAALEFEKMVYNIVVKSMRDSVPKSELVGGGYGEDVFTSMLDEEYVKDMTQHGPQSLAEMIYQQYLQQGMVDPADCREKAMLPCRGRVSSEFGKRIDPITEADRDHDGMDIANPEGTQIRAALSGKVVYSGQQEGYGNVVIVKHNDELETVYGHNAENLVKVGDKIERGQVIGTVGSTGRSTGPHLHFEVRSNGKAINPRDVLGTSQLVAR